MSTLPIETPTTETDFHKAKRLAEERGLPGYYEWWADVKARYQQQVHVMPTHLIGWQGRIDAYTGYILEIVERQDWEAEQAEINNRNRKSHVRLFDEIGGIK